MLALFLVACGRFGDDIKPDISYTLDKKALEYFPSAFPPLTKDEMSTVWGTDYKVGISFARDYDFYRAITHFKRALILIPEDSKSRRLEMEYGVVLTYFLANKYSDAIEAFESGGLLGVDDKFPAYDELLLMLYEAYTRNGEKEKADVLVKGMQEDSPDVARRMLLFSSILEGKLDDIETLSNPDPKQDYFKDVISKYKLERKSPQRAQVYNGLLPGAGYLYIGQKKTALTAFLMNGLFIAAAAHFFDRGHTAAGIITTGFEAGWYLGGIHGAGEGAVEYNEKLFKKYGEKMLTQERLFPILMFNYAF